MPDIDYYFSVLSPFAYLAGDRLERIAAGHGARVRYHPVDIVAIGSATGWTPPARRHPARLEYRRQEMTRIAGEVGLPIRLAPAHWPTDPLPASRALAAAIAAAGDSGGDPAPLIRAVLRAVWTEERDIGDPATVDAILRQQGYDPARLAPLLAAGEATYRADSAAAPERGVFGVPFYLVGEARFWGQDRLDALDRHLAGRAGARDPRPDPGE